MSDFLGPFHTATVILMKAQFDCDLPKRRDLKKRLQVPDVNFYKRYGNHGAEISKLETLLETIADINGVERNYDKFRSTDCCVTVPDVSSNLFFHIEFSAQVVEGFNLTDPAMETLTNLTSQLNQVIGMQHSVTSAIERLQNNRDRAIDLGFQDQTLIGIDLEGIKKTLEGYGNEETKRLQRELIDWYETYRWKVSAPALDESVPEIQDFSNETVNATA